MVTEGHGVLDVGCDHGYIPITLLEQNKINCAVLSDVREGPLSRAEEHVKEHNFSHKVRLVCTNGIPKNFPKLLEELVFDPSGKITCVIAGMGGMLMASILEDAAALLDQIDEFVLSPQSDLAYFRKVLRSFGVVIEEEAFLEEDGKFYTILRCVHGNEISLKEFSELSDTELLFGPLLLKEQNPVLKEYLKKREQVLEHIREELTSHGFGESDQRMMELKEEYRKVQDALGRYR